MTENQYKELLQELMKQHSIKKPDIPERLLNSSIDHITKTYAKAYKNVFVELLNELTDNFSALETPSQQQLASVIIQIERRLKDLNSDISQQVIQEVQKQYISAAAVHVMATETVKTIEELMGAVPYSLINQFRAEQLINDTMEDLLFATQHTSKELKKVVRDIFSKHLQLQGLEGTSYDILAKQIRNDLSRKGFSKTLTEKGFVGIIDKSGRRWNLKTYVEMVVNTKMKQAYCEGMKDKSIETGNDLAVISERSAKDPCRHFEGMVISMTGRTKGYMTYDQLKATGLIFHPNCRHTPYPVINFDLLHPEDIEFHNKKVAELKQILNKKKSSK